MTETKQDLQAQIDQLDAEWEQGLDSHKIRVNGALALPEKECSSFEELWSLVLGPIIGLLLVVFVVVPDLFYWGFNESSWKYLIPLLLAEFYLFSGWRRVSRISGYFEQLKLYESKRAELQAKLDALD